MPIEPHHAGPLHTLREVLVGRHHEHAIDARVGRGAHGERRERVVRFEFVHRPGDDPERPRDALSQRDLREQVRFDPLARIVTVEQVVPKRLDHGVERHGSAASVAAPR